MADRKTKPVREISISTFRAKCVGLLQEVSKTRTPFRVTRRGKPIADVFPASSEGNERSWIGSMSGTVKIFGDIVSPVFDREFATEAVGEKLAAADKPAEKPWLKLMGKLKHLRPETARINRLIEEDSERTDPESRR